jgi:hypothetical protein
MHTETRIEELRRAIDAGEYAPSADAVAGEIVATLALIRRARRRIEALNGGRFEPEAAPPRRRFEPRPLPTERFSEARPAY